MKVEWYLLNSGGAAHAFDSQSGGDGHYVSHLSPCGLIRIECFWMPACYDTTHAVPKCKTCQRLIAARARRSA
jgi:hypothetical protein